MALYLAPVGLTYSSSLTGKVFGPLISDDVPWERVGAEEDQPEEGWIIRVPPASFQGEDEWNPLDLPIADL